MTALKVHGWLYQGLKAQQLTDLAVQGVGEWGCRYLRLLEQLPPSRALGCLAIPEQTPAGTSYPPAGCVLPRDRRNEYR